MARYVCFRSSSFFNGIISLLLLSAAGIASAQNPTLQFAHAIGNGSGNASTGSVIRSDAAGNIYTLGLFSGYVDFDPGSGATEFASAGGNDIFLTKHNAAGNFLWAIPIGGTSNSDNGIAMSFDGSGNIVVAGVFGTTADFNPGTGVANLTATGTTDVFVAKYDAAGNYLWAFNLGSTGQESVGSVAVDGSGNITLAGYFSLTLDFDPGAGTANLTAGTTNANTDVFVAKYSASGAYLWAFRVGSTSSEVCRAMTLDPSGNIVISGYSQALMDFDPGPGTANPAIIGGQDGYLAKYDPSGNYIWAFRTGGTGATEGREVACDAGGNIVLTGSFAGTVDFDPSGGVANLTTSSVSNQDAFIARYSSAGSYQWAFKIGNGNVHEPCSIAIDAGSNIAVTGGSMGTIDFDPGAGTANITSAAGNFDIFVAKYTSSGAYLWAFSAGAAASDFGRSVTCDPSGSVWITGSFRNTVDFDPGGGTANHTTTAVNGNDFVAKYSSAGAYLSSYIHTGPGGPDFGFEMITDPSGNIYTVGTFTGGADFDPGAGITPLVSAGGGDAYLAKYTSAGALIWAFPIGAAGDDAAFSVMMDADGNLVVTGSISPGAVDFDPGAGSAVLSPGTTSSFIAKYSSAGAYITAALLGQTPLRYAALDAAGNIICTGTFSGTIDADPGAGTVNLTSAGGSDFMVAKYSPALNYMWAFRIGGIFDDGSWDVAVDNNGDILVAGYTGNATVDFDPGAGTATYTPILLDGFVAKYSSSGGFVWVNRLGGSGNSDECRAVATDAARNVVVTGSFSETADFDPGAGIVNLTANGSIKTDVYLAKYNANGTYLWAFKIGGTDIDGGTNIALRGSDVYLTGNFNGTADFDPGAGVANLVGTLSEPFIAKYNQAGLYQWAFPIDASSTVVPSSLAVGGAGSILLTGGFLGNADCDPTASTTLISSKSSLDFDIFLVKYAESVVGDPPVITCPGTINTTTTSGLCTGAASFAATATGTEPITITYSHASGSAFPLGTTTVTATATNAIGTSTCNFTVQVAEGEPPSVSCPSNIQTTTATGQCTRAVTYTPTTSNVTALNYQMTGATTGSGSGSGSGSTFNRGTTTVTITGTGICSNASCSFTVLVNDSESPVPSIATLPTISGDCSAYIPSSPTATDNCAGAITGVTSSPTVYTTPGTYTVVWSYNDGNGNTSTQQQTVVVNDNQPLCSSVAWYNAGRITGVGDNAGISSWIDVVGMDDNATQSNASLRPTYQNNASANIAGNPVVQFGAGKGMGVAARDDLTGGGEKTIFAVFRTGSDATTRQMLLEIGGAGSGFNLYIDNLRLYAGVWETQRWWINRIIGTNRVYLAQMVYDGTRLRLSVSSDGVTSLASTNLTDFLDPFITPSTRNGGVGATQDQTRYHNNLYSGTGFTDYFKGRIAEMLVLNTSNATTRTQVFNYLNEKYDVQAGSQPFTKECDLPESHLNELSTAITVSPNPANDQTGAFYTLSAEGGYRLVLQNMLGMTVAVLDEGVRAAGNYGVEFSASGLPAGMYRAVLHSAAGVVSVPVVIEK